MNTPPCEWLAWDSAFFGLRIARVSASRLDVAQCEAITAWACAHAIDCLYFLADPDDAATPRLAEASGFQRVDTRLTLETPRQAMPPSPPAPTSATIGPVVPAEVERLRAIASVSHRDSRFYADGGFERAQCDRLYATWIENSCRDVPAGVLVARRASEASGYVACQVANGTGQISLIAVAAEAQGQGLGKALVAAGLGWCWQEGARKVSVVTQGRNLRAIRLYEGFGFRVVRTQVWYHRWFGPAAEAPLA